MVKRTKVLFYVAHRTLTALVIAGLALTLWPTQAAWAAAEVETGQAEPDAAALPLTVSRLARTGTQGEVGLGSGGSEAPLAQVDVYLYTISLPPDTAVVMGEHRAVLPFVVGNVPTSTASIDSVRLDMDAGIYWINEATSAPPGWQVTQIKNAGAGLAWIQFDALTPGAAIPPGGELTFEVIVAGNKFGVFPTTSGDVTDALQDATVQGGGQVFALSGALPSWPRYGLSATLSASPSSLGIGSPLTLIMEVTNYSAITQTAVVPSTPGITGTGAATLASGPTPPTLSLASGQTRSFTWVYTATASGQIVFSANASNTLVSTAIEQTDPVYIGPLTVLIDLKDTQVISGQLATVQMRVQNNGVSAVLDVEPSALDVLGTANAALASGPEPPIVPYLDAGATASFQWAYTITGDVGTTYAFSGTASAQGAPASNAATSAEGQVVRYLVTVTPRFAVIGTVNQALVFDVTNGGAEAVSAIDFTLPSGFSYAAGNASGGYGGNWTIGRDGVGTPQYIEFSAPALQELPVGETASFTITFAALPAAPAEYSFAVRVEDTTGLDEYVEAFVTVTGYEVTVEAAPTSGLYADGRSTSVITATVTSGGAPQEGEEVRFETTVGVLTHATVSTNASGVATTTLVAPHSSLNTSATVTARSNGAQDEVVISYLGSYELTVDTLGSGTVEREPRLVGYRPGEVVTLTATADLGWTFDGWSGDLSGLTNPITITMDGPKVVTATFTQDKYTLTLNYAEGGSAVPDPDQATYVYGDVITLTATADPGWTFAGWSGDLVSSANPAAFTILSDAVITATFLQDAYPLDTYVVEGGSITRDPDQATYLYGTVVTVTAVPVLGWSFTGWSGDLAGDTNPETITITGAAAITATFTQDQYSLTLDVVGEGSLTVEPDQPAYVYGDAITVTAVPTPGWSFAGFSGALGGTTSPATYTIVGDTIITATFTQDEYILTLDTVGLGQVSPDPDQGTYLYGDVVTLTATAELGWSFGYWFGGLGGTTNPAAITIQGNTTVGAVFTQDEYALVVGTVGSGTVTRDPDLVTYSYGEVVTVTAEPTPGWSFAGWSGDLGGDTNPETINITGNTAITATFTQDQYTLVVNVVGGGSVGLDPDQATYLYDEVVTLTATADPGWSFAGWSGDLGGDTNPETINITGNTAITATFTQDEYTLTVNLDPAAGGTVNLDPDQATYQYGDVVTLTAVANAGWAFGYWSGALSGTANPEPVTIFGDTVVTATFQSDTPVGPYTSLSISPKTGSILPGESITYTAQVTGTYGSWDVSADALFSIEAGAGGSWTGNVYQPGNAGSWMVTVEYGGLNDTAQLMIGQAKLYLPLVTRAFGP